MNRVALKMLLGDKGKYLSLVFGLAFAVLLITQQCSIFLGLLLRATGPLQNISQPDLWIADPFTRFIGEVRPLPDNALNQVRSVPGIAWATPFFTSRAEVELPNGTFKSVQVVGVDRSTLIGQPPEMLEGNLEDLRYPDAVIIEESSREKLGDLNIGDVLKLNDQRAVVVGFCRAKLGFESNILAYTTYENALKFVPGGRERLSFILAKVKDPAQMMQVQIAINQRFTDLKAFTTTEIRGKTVNFILMETGIGINFSITVFLGFVVGLVVASATFYQFTLENLRYFAVLKAMGAGTATLVQMILLQAMVVGVVAFGIGTGLASIFSLLSRQPGAELATFFPWQLLVGSLIAMLICVSLGSLLSLRRVITLEPAIVFK